MTRNGNGPFSRWRLGSGRAAVARVALLTLVAAATLILPGSPASAYYPDPYAYVPNCTNNGVSVVSLATNQVVKTLAVPSTPLGVGINPGGTRAYVSVQNAVMVYDTLQDTLLTVVPNAGPRPGPIAVDPTGTFAYVTNPSYGGPGPLTVISVETNTIVARIPSIDGSAGFLAFNPAGTRLYVTDYWGIVYVVDVATHSMIGTIPVGNHPTGVAVNPSGTRLYVANGWDNTVSVIDLATHATIATIPVGSQPEGVALNPSGTRLYVANNYSGTISVIDTATNTVVTNFSAGYGVQAIAFNPDNPAVGYFVRFASGNALLRFSTTSNTTIGFVGVGSNPCDLAVSRGYGA
ncbi:beta-propeller fold lactonase family protein [Micromonospora sp. NPDC050417]|uniref:YncE family protein n=1 Tax=Micromonospora sp. NPDC050417 TaxID=3364280 RepID=UPI003795A108